MQVRIPKSFSRLAKTRGRVDGMLSYSVRPDLYHAGNSVLIEELVVDEGLGSALIISPVEKLYGRDCREVCLAVMPENERAIRFYRSHGLVEEGIFLEKHF